MFELATDPDCRVQTEHQLCVSTIRYPVANYWQLIM